MKRKSLLFQILIVFLMMLHAVMPFFAQTVEEIEHDDDNGQVMSLFEIERLIRRTDYTEALKQLNIYIEKRPDYFDNAQRLIKIIMNRRKQYSILAEKAIKSSTEDPEDHETPAKIILQMRSIEKNPPAEIKRMIDMLEEMHLFKYYAFLFDKILNESAELSEKGEYFTAISQVISEGFDIYKDEYYDSFENENTQMIQNAEEIISDLNAAVARFEDPVLQRDFDNISAQYLRAINNDNYVEAAALYPQFESVCKRYIDIRNEVYGCGEKIKDLYEIQKDLDNEITDASYLPFIQRFILGVQSPKYSGILGAIDCKFTKNIETIKTAILDIEKQHENQYLTLLPEEILDSSIDYVSLTNKSAFVLPLEEFTKLGKNTNGLYSLLQGDISNLITNTESSKYDILLNYEPALCDLTIELLNKSQDFQKEQDIQKTLLAQTNTDIRPLFDSVFRMTTILGSKSSLMPSSFEWGSAYLSLPDKSQWAVHTELYNKYLDKLFETSAASMTDSWTIITDSYRADSDRYVSDSNDYKYFAAAYSSGFDEPIDSAKYKSITQAKDGSGLLDYAKNAGLQKNPVYRYPELSVRMYEYSRNKSTLYIEDIEEKQKSLNDNLNAHEDWLQNEALVEVVKSSIDYMQARKSELELNRMQSSQLLAEENVKLDEAAYSKNYAASIIEESRDALARGNLNNAEKLLLEASEKYSESLAIADNEELRNEVDRIVAALSTQIMDAKNELVVKESRQLYTQARDALNYDRYEDSEALINAAINKWAETHTEKNPEFENFLELVNTAVSMKTGRILIPSDPLYSEMSQLLSIAYQYYDEGEALLKKGDSNGADEALSNAEENLNKIKAVYPLNNEASLLLLKIDRLHDPVKFEEEFAQKVKSAIAQSKKKDTMAQVYNTLTDYYNLEPDYKGLKEAIYNLEIELGMRQRPVDNSAQARSTRLTTQAQNQFNSAGSNTAKLNQALETVNEALRINPNNRSAEALKDRISLKIGSSTIIVLSSSDQNLLTQAKKAYQTGNIDDANTYMLRLLNNNPNNIKIKEVEDLNNKIKSQL